MTATAPFSLDTRGLFCPEPMMLLHKAMRQMAAGEELIMYATDPSTERDLQKFCAFLHHELLAVEQTDDEWRFVIRKASKSADVL